MPKLDRAFTKQAMERFGRLKPDAKGSWGTLTGATLIPHLLWAVNYSMGKHGQQHDNSNWALRTLVAPLAVNGLLPLPKNVKFKTAEGKVDTSISDPGTIDDLAAAMEEFIAKEEAGTLRPARHAAFGDIGAEGWSKLHVVHLKHHLKQFGV